MAARMTRKAIAASTMPATLPPTTTSESMSPSTPAARTCAVFGPRDSAYRPPANRAGRPAPAIRPNTMIFQSALRLIQDIVQVSCRCSGRGRLGGDLLGGNPAGPLRVHVVVVDLGGPRAPEDEPGERGQDDEVDDDAGAAADAVGDAVGGR